jgi:hypothetical protein
MPVLDLPLDVIWVIGGHLAGMHAFGTLAALHLVSHDVAETVLPILYETVILDDMDRPLSNIDQASEGQKAALQRYTK